MDERGTEDGADGAGEDVGVTAEERVGQGVGEDDGFFGLDDVFYDREGIGRRVRGGGKGSGVEGGGGGRGGSRVEEGGVGCASLYYPLLIIILCLPLLHPHRIRLTQHHACTSISRLGQYVHQRVEQLVKPQFRADELH